MAAYGLDKVRGGTYCRLDLTPEEADLIAKEI